MKVIGADVGAFEREEWVESIVLSPAERYIVHVRFDEPGDAVLVNRVQRIDHLGGTFFAETDTLGVVHVAASGPGAGPGGTPGPSMSARAPGPEAAPASTALAFDTLRTNLHAAREIALYREHFDDPVDHELTFTMETSGIPFIVDRLMRFDSAYFRPVEWNGTMPMMNWNSMSQEVRWMAHCHISEHLESGMRMVFEVGGAARPGGG